MPTLRNANVEDYQDILELKRHVHLLHVGHAPKFYKDVQIPITRAEYNELLQCKDKAPIYVLSKNQAIIGYAFIKFVDISNNPLIYDQKIAFIDDFCIKAEFQQKGYGKYLMNEIIRIAKESGCSSIQLNVWDWNNQAKQFYQKMGMREKRIRMHLELI